MQPSPSLHCFSRAGMAQLDGRLLHSVGDPAVMLTTGGNLISLHFTRDHRRARGKLAFLKCTLYISERLLWEPL